MKKTAILLMLLLLIAPLFASNLSISDGDQVFLDEILASDIPITYGEESFRERILERTKGERDPIGLVLTGGSARACAHIGVLKYLEEQGIVPDYIISNSMGSIIGMLYAAGVAPDQIERFLLEGDLSNLFSLTLPIGGGILVPTGFRSILESAFGPDFRLEDTAIPIMVVSDDLVTKREVRIAEGDFTDILIGSFALPVYFDPFEYNGHLLIDGGVISLAPIDVAYEFSDTVLVSTTFYDAENLELINPITILNASYDIGKRQRAASVIREHDDFIWIRCNVEKYSFMAFDKAVEMAAIGYESASRVGKELDSLYKAGLSPEMERTRVVVDPVIDSIQKDLSYFDRVSTVKPTILLGLSFDSMSFGNTNYYLKDSSSIAVNFDVLSGPIEAGAFGGFGFDSTNLNKSAGFFSIGGDFAWYPYDNIRLTAEFIADFGRYGSVKPSLFFREGIDYVPLHENGVYSFRVHQSLEYFKDYALSDKSAGLLISLSTDFDYNWDMIALESSLGYILSGKSIILENPGNFIHADVSGRAYFNRGKNWFAELGAFSRFRVDNLASETNRVPFFSSDGYTSTMIENGSLALYSNAKYHNTIISLSGGYKFQKDPTFGEAFILGNTELGLYCDFLISDTRFGLSTGVDLSTELSLIGLIELPVSLRMGYEMTPDGRHMFASSLLFSARY